MSHWGFQPGSRVHQTYTGTQKFSYKQSSICWLRKLALTLPSTRKFLHAGTQIYKQKVNRVANQIDIDKQMVVIKKYKGHISNNLSFHFF